MTDWPQLRNTRLKNYSRSFTKNYMIITKKKAVIDKYYMIVLVTITSEDVISDSYEYVTNIHVVLSALQIHKQYL